MLNMIYIKKQDKFYKCHVSLAGGIFAVIIYLNYLNSPHTKWPLKITLSNRFELLSSSVNIIQIVNLMVYGCLI